MPKRSSYMECPVLEFECPFSHKSRSPQLYERAKTDSVSLPANRRVGRGVEPYAASLRKQASGWRTVFMIIPAFTRSK